ncbi:MAG TPA: PfkB family carbohydrate kinase [Opitutus sp.]|nr:PfkB family carbohydrate kinase [Opitutus sp.]
MTALPPHIHTLTGNLLAERTLEFAAWAPGKTQRATRESFQVGGKGINIAKMLNRFGLANTAICFTGRAPGAECKAWMRLHGIAFKAFSTSTPTRSGTVVRVAGQPETTFLGPDAAPHPGALRACAEHLDAQPDGGILAVCGSLPGWNTTDYDPLRAAFDRWLTHGVLVADTYGPPLAWFAARPLPLVKINAVELRTLFDSSNSTGATLASAGATFPVRRWVVSDGPHAIWFRDESGPPASLTPPPIREISPTGSGDILHASLIKSLFIDGLTLPDAVARAIPLAAANAAHPGIAEFPLVVS